KTDRLQARGTALVGQNVAAGEPIATMFSRLRAAAYEPAGRADGPRSCAAPSRGGRGSPSRGAAERSQPRAVWPIESPVLPAPPERVLGRHLGEDQGEAVVIARDHLEEAPRLHLGLLLDRYAPLRQPFPD